MLCLLVVIILLLCLAVRTSSNSMEDRRNIVNQQQLKTSPAAAAAAAAAAADMASSSPSAGRLHKAISSAALGAYRISSEQHLYHTTTIILNTTVIVTATNFAYLHFFHNFKCFMDRLDLKYIVFALDERAYRHLDSQGINALLWRSNVASKPLLLSHQLPPQGGAAGAAAGAMDERDHLFLSKPFNVISKSKMSIVGFLLDQGKRYRSYRSNSTLLDIICQHNLQYLICIIAYIYICGGGKASMRSSWIQTWP